MWRDKLKVMKDRSGLTTKEIAAQSGIPEPTLEKLFAGTTKDPKLTTMQQLVHFLGHTLDDLDDTPIKQKKAPSLPDEAMKIAKDYWGLDRWGRKVVRSVISDEQARMEDEARFFKDVEPEPAAPKVIPLYWSAPAAGIASPILGEDYDLYELKPEDPQGAVFAVKVGGDSMEPYFPEGSIAFCNKDTLQDGDIGVFSIDGESVIKQYHYDSMMGMTYLFSLNRKRSDADVLLTKSTGRTLVCLGRVITKKRYPVPGTY